MNHIMPKAKGFSLIEFIATIIIFSIVSAYLVLRSPPIEAFDIGTQKKTIMHDVRLTQMLSMSLHERYRIVFSSNSYQIQNGSMVPYIHPATNSSTLSLPAGVSLSPSTTIIFDSLGRPYDSGGNLLNTTLTLTLSAASTSAHLTISPQTGFIDE